MTTDNWTRVCAATDLAPNTGVCALVNGEQIAIFYSHRLDEVFAISNYDPIGKANVLSRGLICSLGEQICVASPLYKQHFDLRTGACLEEPGNSVKAYKVKSEGGWISLQA